MTNSNQITNDQIRRLFDDEIKGKKDVYFQISTGSKAANKLNPTNEISENYSGAEKFLKVLDEAFEENPYYIGIELYRKAVKQISKKSFLFKKIILNKEQKQALGSMDNIEAFGGLQGVIKTQVNSQYLQDNNETLKKSIEELKTENKDLINELKVLSGKNSDLKETVKEKNWDIKTLVNDHKRDLDNIGSDHTKVLDGIERKADRFEKILTVGGLVAAKAAGLKEDDLRGILGVDEEKERETEKKVLDDTDIDIEELETFTGKKAEAKTMLDAINRFFTELLNNNEDVQAYNIIASYNNIINYTQADFNNLKSLHDYVINLSQGHKQSPADTIMNQVQNYKQSDKI